jgi:hypothetical protein
LALDVLHGVESPAVLALETVRQEWEDGHRRFEELVRDPVARPRVLAQLEVVTDELRKRIGQTFTLAELAAVYGDADRWVYAAVEERAAAPGWPRTLAIVQAAAFRLYQRGAVDYTP